MEDVSLVITEDDEEIEGLEARTREQMKTGQAKPTALVSKRSPRKRPPDTNMDASLLTTETEGEKSEAENIRKKIRGGKLAKIASLKFTGISSQSSKMKPPPGAPQKKKTRRSQVSLPDITSESDSEIHKKAKEKLADGKKKPFALPGAPRTRKSSRLSIQGITSDSEADFEEKSRERYMEKHKARMARALANIQPPRPAIIASTSSNSNDEDVVPVRRSTRAGASLVPERHVEVEENHEEAEDPNPPTVPPVSVEVEVNDDDSADSAEEKDKLNDEEYQEENEVNGDEANNNRTPRTSSVSKKPLKADEVTGKQIPPRTPAELLTNRSSKKSSPETNSSPVPLPLTIVRTSGTSAASSVSQLPTTSTPISRRSGEMPEVVTPGVTPFPTDKMRKFICPTEKRPRVGTQKGPESSGAATTSTVVRDQRISISSERDSESAAPRTDNNSPWNFKRAPDKTLVGVENQPLRLATPFAQPAERTYGRRASDLRISRHMLSDLGVAAKTPHKDSTPLPLPSSSSPRVQKSTVSVQNKSEVVKIPQTEAKPNSTVSRSSPARSEVSEEVESVRNSPARSEVSEEAESVRNSPASEVLEVQSARKSPIQKRRSLSGPPPSIPEETAGPSCPVQRKSKVVKTPAATKAKPNSTGSRSSPVRSKISKELESVGNSPSRSEVSGEVESVGNSPSRSEVSREVESVENSPSRSGVSREVESVENSPSRSEVSGEVESVRNSPAFEVLEVQSARRSLIQKKKSPSGVSGPPPSIPEETARPSFPVPAQNKSKVLKTPATKAKPNSTGSRSSPARSEISEDAEPAGNSPARSEVSEELESAGNSPASSGVSQMESVGNSAARSEISEELESVGNPSARSKVSKEAPAKSVGNSPARSKASREPLAKSVGNSPARSKASKEPLAKSVGNSPARSEGLEVESARNSPIQKRKSLSGPPTSISKKRARPSFAVQRKSKVVKTPETKAKPNSTVSRSSPARSEVSEEVESVRNSSARSEVSEEAESVGNSPALSEVSEEVESVGNSPARSEVSEEAESVINSPASEGLEVQSVRNSPIQKRRSLSGPPPSVSKKRARSSFAVQRKSKVTKTPATKAKPKSTGSRSSPARSEVSEEVESVRNSPARSEVLEVLSVGNSTFQERRSLSSPPPSIPKRARPSFPVQNKSKAVQKTPAKRAQPKASGSRRKKCNGESCGPPPCSSTCPRWKGDCADWLNSKLVSEDLIRKECKNLGLKLSKQEQKTMRKNANKFLESMMNDLMDNTNLCYGVFSFTDMVQSANTLGIFGEKKLSPVEVKKQLKASVSDERVKKLAEGIIWPADNKQDTVSSFERL